ncbi:DUF305 domain-containing protein [Brevundimonas aveniformis]|uniref:DUF305 domain-containing protein n=1 Tax=Brevundimonas aveniformis TaxID=370977 RepID=UPI000407F80E|nr:DUF305 domain-containing protein [Brevundimonas aveniformis]
MSVRSVRLFVGCSLFALVAAGAAQAQSTPPIVQPGAPGQASRVLEAQAAARISDNRYSDDDVAFMQGMMVHHQQAVDMTALIDGRTNNPEIIAMGQRIRASQDDEIAFMRAWLTERGQTAPMVGAAHAGHMDHSAMDHSTMQGMASPEHMAALAAASGVEFDRLFLDLMIRHHAGAVTMVEHLLSRPGSAYEPALFEFVGDVNNEQQAEIRRMDAALRTLQADPRSTLAGGFLDAEQAISNMVLIASLPKPPGFYDPTNPSGAPLPLPTPDGATRDGAEEARFSQRGPFLSFANTDMAFRGDLMAAGSYHGFNLYRLGAAQPELISSVVCPGGQGDVSIVGDLLIMSVESTNGRIDCGREGIAVEASADRFRGIRIFDISNPVAPVQVGQVQTCRGSHTHSVVSADERSIIVYNSGTASVRDEAELAGCVTGLPGDQRTALFSIDVIEIPVANPSQARIIDSPRVFADEATGAVAGLWPGGDHGRGTQRTSQTNQCHDITVFPSRNLAAGACSGNGIIFDITDPRRPVRIDAVTDPGFAYWHSATFDNEGETVLFTDEWGGGGRPRCQATDPRNWGANAFYDIVDGQLERRGTYKLPAAQSARENCVAHNGSIVPVPGRDIFVQAWYQGGISVIDFTDPNTPYEIAYFDRGPMSDRSFQFGGFWSAYWYHGRIYGTEIARGLDVLELAPSEFLSATELAAANLADQGDTFNPQQQNPVTWPAHPTIARAYVEQLQRSSSITAADAEQLNGTLDQTLALVQSSARDASVAARLRGLAERLAITGSDRATQRRDAALRQILIELADQVG